MIPKRRGDLLRLLVPPALTMLLVLAFFAIFDRWEKLADPINSIAAIVLAGIGFGIGVGIDRLRVSRSRGGEGAAKDAP